MSVSISIFVYDYAHFILTLNMENVHLSRAKVMFLVIEISYDLFLFHKLAPY